MRSHTRPIRRPLMTAVAVATGLALVALLALPTLAAAAKRRGVQRHYAGAAWSKTPSSGGFYASLRLDSARARDVSRGGYIGQTLWVATNQGNTRYGLNKGTPYIQVSVTRGYRGKDVNALVLTQRDARGRYFEGRSGGPAIKFGQKYPISIISQVGGVWKIGLGGENIGTAKTAGPKFGTFSGFAGLESTSNGNSARGNVSELGWLVVNGKAAAPFPGWKLGTGKQGGSVLIERGAGKVGWKDKFIELNNAYGP